MSKFEEQLAQFQAVSRQAWRTWLADNHQTAKGVWLVYYKVKTGKSSVRYQEAVKEALCFGWIDSKVKSLDEERYQQIFTPRKPKSVWSKLNKIYIAELLEQGLMTESGLQKIAIAKINGSWNALDEIEALIIPEDLQAAFNENEIAHKNFEGFNNSTKKNILFWISNAKRPQTRSQRIKLTITAAVNNQSPLAGNVS